MAWPKGKPRNSEAVGGGEPAKGDPEPAVKGGLSAREDILGAFEAFSKLNLKAAHLVMGRETYDAIRREPEFGDTGHKQTWNGVGIVVLGSQKRFVEVVTEPNVEAYR
jgi:hypothetical protein